MRLELYAGLGNKINHLLNGVVNGVKDYNWVVDEFGEVTWEDLFSNKPQGIRVVNTKFRNPLYFYDWFFRFPEKMAQAKEFLQELEPSDIVKRYIINFEEPTIGHSARLKHGHNKTIPPFKIEDCGFLTADCSVLRTMNKHLIQSESIGGKTDLDPDLRGYKGTILSTADWFTLFNCDKIYSYGLPRPGLQKNPHSTFIDPHEIYGKEIVDKSNFRV